MNTDRRFNLETRLAMDGPFVCAGVRPRGIEAPYARLGREARSPGHNIYRKDRTNQPFDLSATPLDTSGLMTKGPQTRRVLPACGILILAAGCSSPLEQQESSSALRESIIQDARRERRDIEHRPEPSTLTRSPSRLDFPPERMSELNAMAGSAAYPTSDPALSPGLLGEPSPIFRIDLRQAVLRAAKQSLDSRVLEFDPAINQSRTIAAEAAFDWTFFTNFDWNAVDEPQVRPFVGAVPVGVSTRQSQSVGYETGIRKRLTSGGALSLSQGHTYTDDRTQGTTLSPDPSQRTFIDIALTQPLLRGAGSDVALAEVRLTRNLERRSIYQYKSSVIETVTAAERAYWQLVQAMRNHQIRVRLLERGVETRDVLASRLAFDVKPSEYSDAVATVERRRADVIRAENTLRQASDSLKLLINDEGLSVGNETLLLPTDEAPDVPISFSLLDSITRALRDRPELQQALLTIDDFSIRQQVADNARLPLLDMQFQTRFQGLDRDTERAYDMVDDAQFVDFVLSAVFEQPIGNREREAEYRAAQLERVRATMEYRRVLQRVALEVKTALRNVTTNYQLIEQTRTSRLAATENLRTLQVQEQTIQSLTPDFLDLKFRRQEALANAEADEVSAIIDYSISLADYYASMGAALERNRIAFVVPEVGENAGTPR